MNYLADRVDAGEELDAVVRDMLNKHMRVIFNGDGYSQEWQDEAAQRGLPNLKNTVDAVDTFASDKNKALLKDIGVMSEEEVEARQNIMYEQYALAVGFEAKTMLAMLNQQVIPSLALDLKDYATPLGELLVGERVEAYKSVASTTQNLANIMAKEDDSDFAKWARFHLEQVIPAMNEARAAADKAEMLCGSWPFPSAQELLFDHHERSGPVADHRDMGVGPTEWRE